mmetsp:Transcript_3929/g.6968  ORF Transcript_3929/g.6968 Transcript_3929/m.6968 type:complete len:108 (+) Transcript_3929:942-1265(+)
MQGHPEAPPLWERHVDIIFKKYKLTSTTHAPCLYLGLVKGKGALLMRQVDDFALAASSKRTANIMFDYVDDELTFPLKRMGIIHMFNGMDIDQTRDYVNILCPTYIE